MPFISRLCRQLLTSVHSAKHADLAMPAGVNHIVDVNYLPSLKDFPEAKDALWSLCRTLHAVQRGLAAADP